MSKYFDPCSAEHLSLSLPISPCFSILICDPFWLYHGCSVFTGFCCICLFGDFGSRARRERDWNSHGSGSSALSHYKLAATLLWKPTLSPNSLFYSYNLWNLVMATSLASSNQEVIPAPLLPDPCVCWLIWSLPIYIFVTIFPLLSFLNYPFFLTIFSLLRHWLMWT